MQIVCLVRRHDAHALMALAAVTQRAAGQEAPQRLPVAPEAFHEPVRTALQQVYGCSMYPMCGM
jgi:hypothetical protein